MGSTPFDPRSSLTLLTDKVLGESYAKVRLVAINIDDVIKVANQIEAITLLNSLEESIAAIANNIALFEDIQDNYNVIQPVGENIATVITINENLAELQTLMANLDTFLYIVPSINNINIVSENIAEINAIQANISNIVNLLNALPTMTTLRNETVTAAIEAEESKNVSTVNRITVTEQLTETIAQTQAAVQAALTATEQKELAEIQVATIDLPTIVRLDLAQTLVNKTLTDPILFGSKRNTLSVAGNHTLTETADIVLLSTNGATTLTIPEFVTNPSGREFKVVVTYVNTDTLTIATDAGINLIWEAGTEPVPTSTNGAVDMYQFIYVSPTLVIGSRIVANAS